MRSEMGVRLVMVPVSLAEWEAAPSRMGVGYEGASERQATLLDALDAAPP
ncbi:hypothetical protein MGN01_06930 [Methylobacterium gnaphalii]|uniref:Uncharacterized protein n=1 Tax=Methylobacterium gnaphalii TaxID=1010610 RepID=A0A512JFY1_9HYPH|nr:hypothetical protein MGN01_06930 [Methylobacterium gnaphalii]GLS47613.1 hypothetical protein GCM10007885_04570 [Methylobacterium gnaphalii]